MRNGGLDTLCHETKEHLHSYERCFGTDGSTGGDPATMSFFAYIHEYRE